MPLVHAAATATSDTILKGEFDILNYNGKHEENFGEAVVEDSSKDAKDAYLTTFTTEGTVSLRFAEADDKTGRQAGYHLAIQAKAPKELTKTEELGKIQYSTDGKNWKSAGLKASDTVLNKWYNITEDEYNTAKNAGNNISRELYLDWDGNGTADQVVKMVIRTGELKFDNHAEDGTTVLHTVKVKNTVDQNVVELTVLDGKSLDDLAESVLNSVKTKAGYEFVRFYVTENEEKKDYETSEEVKKDLVIVAEFKKSGSATTPSENQGSTTKPADKDNTPKTGNTDLMGFVPLMTLLSLVGIVTLKKTI